MLNLIKNDQIRKFIFINNIAWNYLLYLLQMPKIFLCYKYSNGFCNTQSTNKIEKDVNSEVTKSKRGRQKKTDTKINEEEENDIIEREID